MRPYIPITEVEQHERAMKIVKDHCNKCSLQRLKEFKEGDTEILGKDLCHECPWSWIMNHIIGVDKNGETRKN